MAVAEGFEPSDGGYPSHAFEACSLGRSDTPPRGSLPNAPTHQTNRCLVKNASSGAAHSSASTPPRTSGRCVSRRSRTTSHSEPTAPVFGSHAPKTTRATRAITSAPAHIVHGSTVTASVVPSSRQPSPNTEPRPASPGSRRARSDHRAPRACWPPAPVQCRPRRRSPRRSARREGRRPLRRRVRS